MIFWVYLVECADGAYYVGSHRGPTIETRVDEHNLGVNPKAWTYRRRPVKLLKAWTFPRADEMVAFERQLKGWSRAKKEAFMREDWERLRALSKSGKASS